MNFKVQNNNLFCQMSKYVQLCQFVDNFVKRQRILYWLDDESGYNKKEGTY